MDTATLTMYRCVLRYYQGPLCSTAPRVYVYMQQSRARMKSATQLDNMCMLTVRPVLQNVAVCVAVCDVCNCTQCRMCCRVLQCVLQCVMSATHPARQHVYAHMQPRADRMAQAIFRLFRKLPIGTSRTTILMGFMILTYYLAVLIVNPMSRILARLVRSGHFRNNCKIPCCALSAFGCI